MWREYVKTAQEHSEKAYTYYTARAKLGGARGVLNTRRKLVQVDSVLARAWRGLVSDIV